jgi:hypothetical protein
MYINCGIILVHIIKTRDKQIYKLGLFVRQPLAGRKGTDYLVFYDLFVKQDLLRYWKTKE